MNEEQCELKADIQEILKNMKEWSVDGNLYFEINDEKAKLLYKYICNLQQEIERLQNIIKEAREYAKSNYKYYTGVNDVSLARKQVHKEYLAILDKENE